MPFKSKKQARFFFAKEARGELPKGTAKRWARHTPSISKLPERVKKEKRIREGAMQTPTSGRSIIEEWAAVHGVDPLIERKVPTKTSGRTILEAFLPGQDKKKSPFPPNKDESAEGEEGPPKEKEKPAGGAEDTQIGGPQGPPGGPPGEEQPPQPGMGQPGMGQPGMGQELQTLQISVDATGNIVDGPEGLIGMNVTGTGQPGAEQGLLPQPGTDQGLPAPDVQPAPPGMPAAAEAPVPPGVPQMTNPRQPGEVPTSPNVLHPSFTGQPQPQPPGMGMEQPVPPQPGMGQPGMGQPATPPQPGMGQPPGLPQPGFTPNSSVALGFNQPLGMGQPAPSPEAVAAAIGKHSIGLNQDLIQILNMAATNPRVPLKQLMANAQLAPTDLAALKVAWHNIRQELTKPVNPNPLNPLITTPMGTPPVAPPPPGAGGIAV